MTKASPVLFRALRLLSLACLWVVTGFVAPSATSGQVAAPRPPEADFFYSNGLRVPLTILRDSVAVTPRDGVAPEQLERAVGQFGLRIVRELPAGVVLLGGPDPFGREEHWVRASRLRQSLPEIITNAGVMVRPRTDTTTLFLTDEILVQFHENATPGQVEALAARLGLERVPAPYLSPNQFVLRRLPGSTLGPLAAANRLHEDPLVQYSQPNFIRVPLPRHVRADAMFIPDDALFGEQWHLHNTGQGGGTVDADVDAPQAWALTRGSATVVIAVIDDGFDMAHEDLVPNLWTNPGEIPGNGIDDDGNGFVDDVNGWDFTGNDNNPSPGGNHGTPVAGLAAARGDNGVGVSGSCPECRLMLLRNGNTIATQAQAFNYARQNGAAIITNSWGYNLGAGTGPVVTAINNAATAGRGGLGSVVLFAMNNIDRNDCIGTPDISSLPNVIAVSASSNQDRKVTESGWGNCMDVLAPTHRGYGPNPNGLPAGSGAAFTGTLNVATTDRSSGPGYNNANPQNATWGFDPTFCPTETGNRAYSFCFGGTSAATPITAGVAGLILSVDATLSRLQVQRLLQDATDRTEPSAGQYADATGFSTPASGVASHGYGRVNAFEAVRIVARAASGGRAGADVFFRDNRLDWGNTEQPSHTLFEPTRGFIGHWESMDIKVDAPPYQPAPTAATFDAFTDETPSAVPGEVNRVYVRVRNRGPVASGAATVRLFWTQFGTALPALPADFWSVFPNNSADAANRWNPLDCSTGSPHCTISSVAYSGSSVAGTLADAAQVVRFDFAAPPVDASLPNHFCLLAMVDAAPDRPLPLRRPAPEASDFVVDWLTPRDNNVTHRNYLNLETTRSRSFTQRFFVRNPLRETASIRLRTTAPRGWDVAIAGMPAQEPIVLGPGEERLLTVQLVAPQRGAEGEVTLIQERVDVTPSEVMGGATFSFRAPGAAPRPRPRPALSLHAGVAVPFAELNTYADAGPAVTVDFFQPFTARLGADLRLGYSRFRGRGAVSDIEIWDASANLKAILTPGRPWLFANGGGGVYRVDGGDWEGGVNIGAGLGHPLSPKLTVEAAFNYHRIFTTAPDLEYGKAQLGVLWSF